MTNPVSSKQSRNERLRRLLDPYPVCECGHAKSDHRFRFSIRDPGTGWCGERSCTCPQYTPRAALAAVAPTDATCTGHCIGTARADTLVEDLTCPIHGIEAQERAKTEFSDRQAWLDSIAPTEAKP